MKKKPNNESFSLKWGKKKILLTMKLFISLFLLSVLNVSGSVFSQNTTFDLEVRGKTVKEVFKDIESQSQLRFLYNDDFNGLNRIVSLNTKDKGIDELLNELLAGANLTYRALDNELIVITPEVLINQEHVITGTVMDLMGEPVVGASVIVKGTTIGTVTSVNGEFTLTVPPDATTLMISFVGMETQEIEIDDQKVFSITLREDYIGLEEVVAIGYGLVQRSDLTGSVSSISGESISMQAAGNPVMALTGLSTGVQIMPTSGQPGASIGINIRGANSISASNQPLFVVDGFPIMGDISALNTQDIESIEILKDASATAIYGSRGANGVILVTTKKGREGKTLIQYNSYYGIQEVGKRIDMLNAREFAELANLQAANDKMNPYFTTSEIAAFGEGTNWQDEIFRSAPIQNHSLSISGGTSNTIFSISGSYFDQDGIILNTGYQTLQLRTNIEHNISPNWSVRLNSIISQRDFNNTHGTAGNTERGAGVLDGGVVTAPTLTPRDEVGNYTNVRAYAFTPDISENPVAMALERRQLARNRELLLNAVAEGQLLENLRIFSSVGVEYDVRRGDFYSPSIFQPTARGSANITYSEAVSVINENLLTYSMRIGENHNLNAMGGITAETRSAQAIGASTTGFLSDILQNYSLQAGDSPGTPNSSLNEYSILSYLGRINYDYRNKYLLTTTFRADGSSRFGADNRWGFFPSAAFAWRVSQEDFWPFVDHNLKLRASWGRTGNTALSPYQSLTVLSSTNVVFDKRVYVAYAPGTVMPNPNLKWETTSQWDIGADIGLFNNRLFLVLDYYQKRTYDLLASVPVVISTGYQTQFQNIGDTENKGFEIGLDSRIISRSQFNWQLGANISANRNKVVMLPGGTDIFGPHLINVLPAMNIVREGEPLGSFYGYVEDGINDNGTIRYVDLTGDGQITPLDRTIIGDPNPDFIIGVNSKISYQNFDLNLIINAVQGVDVLNANLTQVSDGFSFGLNQTRDVLGNYWTEQNPDPNAKYPRISRTTRYLGSDRFVEDGSYIQISNIKLSYSLRGERFIDSPFYNSQFYINIQNLYTFTNYTFFSPAMNTRGSGIARGIDMWGYPYSRKIMLGVSINL